MKENQSDFYGIKEPIKDSITQMKKHLLCADIQVMLVHVVILCISVATFSSCSDMDSYFETPSWLRGSIYQELQSDGNYTVFLRGADIAGFKPMLDGKSILTVMAPTDDAMKTYLKDTYGVDSIGALSKEEITKLIGFHILYYSFDKNKLINFRPNEGDGATDEEKLVNAGLYYKFRTKSQDPITIEKDTSGTNVSVYHLERYLPVFSYMMFRTKGIDAKTNYNYFYPETGWQDDAGFNVANAGVTDYDVITKNGYIYKLDRVLKPLNTIYSELKTSGKYTKFLSLYDKYQYYLKDNELTINYGNGTDLYQHYHSAPLANIACEWPVTSYTNVAALAMNSYSVFAPTDKALDDFFNDYWKLGGYDSLTEVSSSSVQDLLFNCVYSRSIVFPEEITKGLIENSYGTVIKFDPTTVNQEDRIICSNGALYGCSVLTPPVMFGSVTGPGYQYKKYSNFLYMLTNSGMVSTLCSDAVNYIMLYPDNDQMLSNAGISYNSATGKLVTNGSSSINGSAMQNYIYAHVVAPTDGSTTLPTSGMKVYTSLSPNMKLYWYLKNGKITNCIRHNDLLKYSGNTTTEADVFSSFSPLAYRGNVDGWTNGHCYSYTPGFFEGSFDNVSNSKFIATMWAHHLDATTEFFGWINLLDKAGLIDHNSQSVSIMAESCMMFVPVTNAVENAIKKGSIPGITADESASTGSETFFDNCTITDKDQLQFYLKQYFIPMSTAVVSNYPYIGWGENTSSQGGLITMQQQETVSEGKTKIVSTNMNIYDNGSKLSVGIIDSSTGKDKKLVNVTSSYDYFPFVFDDGCAHFIEDVF